MSSALFDDRSTRHTDADIDVDAKPKPPLADEDELEDSPENHQRNLAHSLADVEAMYPESSEQTTATPKDKDNQDIPEKDLALIRQTADSHVERILKERRHRGAVGLTPELEARVTAAAWLAAEQRYRANVSQGQAPAKARKGAGFAAKEAIQKLVDAELIAIAQQAAAAAIADESALDTSKLMPDARSALAGYKAGATSDAARRLAPLLDGKDAPTMLRILDAEVDAGNARKSTEQILDPTDETKTQDQTVYTFTDGTLIRIKPRGDVFNPGEPMYSVEVKQTAPSDELEGQAGVAFKVDDAARPVPKGPSDLGANPFVEHSQREEFLQTVMRAGHRKIKTT